MLRTTVSSLLSSCRPELQPAAVLDFLTACLTIPRLWQGRDQRPPKHASPPDVLGLAPNQLASLTEYILAEAEEDGGGAGSGAAALVRGRVPLLLRCLPRPAQVEAVTGRLVELAATPRSNTARLLLLELYLKVICRVFHLFPVVMQ